MSSVFLYQLFMAGIIIVSNKNYFRFHGTNFGVFLTAILSSFFPSIQCRIQDFQDYVGANPKGYANVLFGISFAENNMKMKKIDTEGAARHS